MQVLTLDASGIPHRWASQHSVIKLKYEGNVAWEYAPEESETFFGGTSRLTGNRTSISVAPIVAVKGRFRFGKRTPPLTNANLFRRDLHTCAYCGRFHPTHKLNRDHIVPQSRGGEDTWLNCITSCKTCNWEKADRTPVEADMDLLFKPYVPSHIERLILQNPKILHCQHEYLAALLPDHSRVKDASRVVSNVNAWRM